MKQLIDGIIFTPALFAVLILLLPRSLQSWSRPLAVLGSAVVALMAMLVWGRFDPALPLVFKSNWLPQMGIAYEVAIDGLNLPLVALTAVLTPLLLLGTWSTLEGRQQSMTALVLLMETGALGSFLSQDLFLFYVFWELILVPAYLLVGMYGGADRGKATLQFFLYTFAGSLLMLLAIAWLIYQNQVVTGMPSASFSDLQKLALPYAGWSSTQGLLCLAFGAAFFIKAPLIPFHGWMPATYRQAPALVTIYLAAILSKMGTYGILKFMLPLFPQAMQAFSPVLMWLAAGGIIYGALLALAQSNLKAAVAYSSLSHVSYILLGLFSLQNAGIAGALLQMVNHGIVIAGLFLIATWLEQRRGTQELADFGGWARQTPFLATFFMIFVLASVALPGTNGFVGEIMVLLASFRVHPAATVFAAFGMVLGALYMLNVYQKTMLGPTQVGGRVPADLSFTQAAVATVLGVFVVVIGLAPQPYLDKSKAAVAALVVRVQVVAAAEAPAASVAASVRGLH